MPDSDAGDGRRKAAAAGAGSHQPVDPDVDLHNPGHVRETRPRTWDLVVATALGGVVGAEARYGVSVAMSHEGNQFPWSTLIINATGSLVIGVLMVLLLELTSPHRLMRPFVGVGVLGGYTTYSTFAVDTEQLVRAHRPGIALAYVVLTALCCLLAVIVGSAATRAVGEAIITSRTRNARTRRRRP